MTTTTASDATTIQMTLADIYSLSSLRLIDRLDLDRKHSLKNPNSIQPETTVSPLSDPSVAAINDGSPIPFDASVRPTRPMTRMLPTERSAINAMTFARNIRRVRRIEPMRRSSIPDGNCAEAVHDLTRSDRIKSISLSFMTIYLSLLDNNTYNAARAL